MKKLFANQPSVLPLQGGGEGKPTASGTWGVPPVPLKGSLDRLLSLIVNV